MKSRLNPFLVAHGAATGPRMFPVTAGLLSGLFAFILAAGLLTLIGAQQALEKNFNAIDIYLAEFLFGTLAGGLYGKIYRRAALDRKGGWMFGMSFGFLLWTIFFAGIVTLLFKRPIITGFAAIGFFLAHLFFGFVLGASFPLIHFLISHKKEKKARLS